jgi:hydroxyethylthiazole kinase-like sugar kinase family protein
MLAKHGSCSADNARILGRLDGKPAMRIVTAAGCCHAALLLLATFRRKIAAGAPASGIAAFAENCKVGRI